METRWLAHALPGLLLMLTACYGHSIGPAREVWSSTPQTVSVPATIRYLAVIHPDAPTRILSDAYRRLDGIVFQLKDHRPTLHILERQDLEKLLLAQQQELGFGVLEERVHGLGRLLGLDALLFFDIRASTDASMASVTMTSKLVELESSEVLFHTVVISRTRRSPRGSLNAAIDSQAMRLALDQAIVQMARDLRNAFSRR